MTKSPNAIAPLMLKHIVFFGVILVWLIYLGAYVLTSVFIEILEVLDYQRH